MKRSKKTIEDQLRNILKLLPNGVALVSFSRGQLRIKAVLTGRDASSYAEEAGAGETPPSWRVPDRAEYFQ